MHSLPLPFPPRSPAGPWLLACIGPCLLAQAPPTGEAYRLAADAYRLQQVGDLEGALRAAEAALALEPRHPQLLALKRNLLFSAGDLEAAEALNQALQVLRPEAPEPRLFQAYLRQRQGRLDEALQATREVEALPSLPKADRRQARLLEVDLLQALRRPGEALAVLDALDGAQSLEVESRRGFLLLSAGRPDQARTAFEAALALQPDPAKHRILLLGLRDAARSSNNPEVELKALQELHAREPADRQISLDLAYALLSRHRDAEALDVFSQTLDALSPPGAWLDAGYAAKRLGRNREAAAYFARGLDARRAAGLQNPRLEYGLRREVESLGRQWGLVSGTAYRQGGLVPGIASQQRILQEGLEIYWQPPFLAREGRMVQVFVQAFETLHSGSPGETGEPTLQGAIGVRAKPFASQNLVLAAQKLVRLGTFALDDWLFRAAYSLDEGTDLRPWQNDWPWWSLYTEGDSFARSGRYLHQLEIRAGHAWRLPTAGGRNVLAPHLVLAGDYDSRLEPGVAGGVGAGVSIRHWFREDAHRAPASWIELTLQGRAQLTSASRGGGVFLTLTCWF